jgi:hypothetical protein
MRSAAVAFFAVGVDVAAVRFDHRLYAMERP